MTPADLQRDRQEVLALWQRNFKGVPVERYSWIYEQNPAGPAACWVATAADRQGIVGATALFPRTMFVGGIRHRAAIAGDFAVDRDCRAFGPALALQKAALAACDSGQFDFLYGFPNPQSVLPMRRSGYRLVGQAVRLTKPLRSRYHLEKSLPHSMLTLVLAWPIDLVMRWTSREARHRGSAALVCETLPSFDERVDQLWKKAATRYSLIGERTSAYLNWRYLRSPHQKYFIFGLLHGSSRELLGYVVWHSAQNRVTIADLLALNDGEILNCLLAKFLLWQRQAGADAVSILYFGGGALLRMLRQYRFSERDRDTPVIVYAAPHAAMFSGIFDQSNWYLLEGDNDI